MKCFSAKMLAQALLLLWQTDRDRITKKTKHIAMTGKSTVFVALTAIQVL